MNNLALSKEHLDIIISILNKYLQGPVKVWVFGSCIKEITQQFSDLDLAIESAPISLETMAYLNYDFDESDLPFKVDLFDWTALTDEFKEQIKQDRVLLYEED